MIKFLLKKSLYDGLESLMNVIFMNIGFMVFILGLYFTMMAFDGMSWLGIIICLVLFFGLSVYTLGVSGMNYGTSCYKKSGWSTFSQAIKEHFNSSVFFFCCIGLVFLTIAIIIPFYLSLGGLIGSFLAMSTVWIDVVLILSLQYFFPLTMYVKNDDLTFKGSFYTLRKCLQLLNHNIGFTVFVFIYSAINLVISFFLGFIIPGLCGVNIFHMNCLRILKQKYDWIEAKKVFDWDFVLAEDVEIMGDKRILDVIFPARKKRREEN